MSPLAWAAAGAAAGMCAALVLVRAGLVPARLVRGGPGGNGRGGFPDEAGAGDTVRVRLHYDDLKLVRDDIQGLHVIRTDLKHVGGLLERLLEEAMAFQRARSSPPRPEPAGGPARDAFRTPLRDPSPGTPPLRGATWQPRERGREVEVQHDDDGGGFDPNPPERVRAPGDPGYPPPAAAPPREPPPDAVYVEASNDVVVPSVRHPPEAWLERRGGDGEVWLNPRVALADPALQRWSTFFEWERREPGARYQAARPAVVTWSGDSGTVLRKGVARPV